MSYGKEVKKALSYYNKRIADLRKRVDRLKSNRTYVITNHHDRYKHKRRENLISYYQSEIAELITDKELFIQENDKSIYGRDYEIWKLFYIENLTQEYIASKFGINHQRVSQILKKIDKEYEDERLRNTTNWT